MEREREREREKDKLYLGSVVKKELLSIKFECLAKGNVPPEPQNNGLFLV